MIELKSVSRTYRLEGIEVHALRSASFRIESGEFVAITGASGSGKSTLLHILGLLDRPTEGSYLFNGKDVQFLSDDERAGLRSSSLGFVFQQFGLLSRTSAEHNVMLPLLYGSTEDAVKKVHTYLNRVGLGDRLSHFPNQLSGGQQQRVAIARALVNQPHLILADEPTGNLDSATRDEIMALLGDLNREGLTIVIVTHEEEISRMAERVIRMKDGHIIEDKRNADRSIKKENKNKETQTLDARSRGGEIAGRFSLSVFREHIKQALAVLLAHRLRSFLSILGVLIGVACLMTMLSIGKGAEAELAEQLSSLGSNLLRVVPGPENVRGVRLQLGEVARFTHEDVEAIRTLIPGVKQVSGYASSYGRATFRNRNWSTMIAGVSESYIPMFSLGPAAGRAFTQVEDLRRERIALLGPTVVRELFGDEDPVGKSIRIERLEFMVVGVLEEKGGSTWRDRDDIILIPLRTAMARLVGSPYMETIHVEASSEEDLPYVTQELKDLLRRRHRIREETGEAFHVRNMADVQEALSSSTKTFSMLLGAVAAVSLLVGGIGIMNIMLVSVTERTREIGIRKAVGARNRDVLFQFLVESVVLSVLGGVFGILLGVAVALLVAALAGWPSLISINSMTAGFLFSVALGVGFGVWPAYQAGCLSPIDALRYE